MTVGSARMLTCASAVAVIVLAGIAPHAVGTSAAYSASGGQEGATTAPLLAELALAGRGFYPSAVTAPDIVC